MGKRINSKNILQINKKNTKYIWDSKYFEKNNHESQFFISTNLEIKKFIEKLLKQNNQILHTYKIEFVEKNLKIFLSYINKTLKLNEKLKKKKFKDKNFKYFYFRFFIFKKLLYKKLRKFEIKTYYIFNILFLKFLKFKKKLTLHLNNHKITNTILLESKKFLIKNTLYLFNKHNNIIKVNYKFNQQYLTSLLQNNEKKKIKKQNNNYLEKIFETLNKYTKYKYNNHLLIKQNNKNLNFNLTSSHLQFFKKIITKLREFKSNFFFSEGINLLILFHLEKEQRIELLSNFIIEQLKSLKRHNFFFKFLKKTLSLFILNNESKIKNIKIQIKGRINGKPRARKKSLTIAAKMPRMTLNSSILYDQKTAYTSNGTLGVKIWVLKKKNITKRIYTLTIK